MPGAPVSEATYADLEPRIKRLVDLGHTPGLATILVGDDGASAGYIRMKQEKAAEVGMTSPHIRLPADAQQSHLVAAIRAFNDDPTVDAMLVRFGIETIQVDLALARRAAAVRVRTRLKLPDAYALATAIHAEKRGYGDVVLESFDTKVVKAYSALHPLPPEIG